MDFSVDPNSRVNCTLTLVWALLSKFFLEVLKGFFIFTFLSFSELLFLSQRSTLFCRKSHCKLYCILSFRGLGFRSVNNCVCQPFIGKGCGNSSLGFSTWSCWSSTEKQTRFSCNLNLLALNCGKTIVPLLSVFCVLEREWKMCRVLITILISSQSCWIVFSLYPETLGEVLLWSMQ